MGEVYDRGMYSPPVQYGVPYSDERFSILCIYAYSLESWSRDMIEALAVVASELRLDDATGLFRL